jgi:hypothetical protein
LRRDARRFIRYGRVLAASSAETAIVTQALDISTQTWSVIDPNAVDGGSAAMYLPGKVLKSGTSTNPDDPTVPSAPTAYVLVRARIRGERFGKWPSSRWIASFKLLPKRYPTLPLLAMGPAKSHSNSFPTAVTNFWPLALDLFQEIISSRNLDTPGGLSKNG